MSPSHAVKKGVRYRYYVSTAAIQGRRADAGTISRVPAAEIERVVLEALRDHIAGVPNGNAAATRSFLKAIELHIAICSTHLELTWSDPSQASNSAAASDATRTQFDAEDTDPSDHDHDDDRRHLIVPYVVNPHKRRREIILPASAPHLRPMRSAEQQNLVQSIAQGQAWLQRIVAGASLSSIAAREHRTERMIRMTVSLAFLDPTLVRAILHGTLPRGVSVRRLVDPPMSWHKQWQAIGLSRPV